MTGKDTKFKFDASILRPERSGDDSFWAFVVLPKDASAMLPRRGRTTVTGTINGQDFQALLEPDGQKSHWLRINEELLKASGAVVGEVAQFEIKPVEQEPEPEIPADLLAALEASPDARPCPGAPARPKPGISPLRPGNCCSRHLLAKP